MKDKRYTTINKLINANCIHSFREIFDTLPKSIVARDLGMNNLRFSRLIHNVDQLFLSDIFRIAALLEIKEELMIEMVYAQYVADKKG